MLSPEIQSYDYVSNPDALFFVVGVLVTGLFLVRFADYLRSCASRGR
jgi:hypothetical protein